MVLCNAKISSNNQIQMNRAYKLLLKKNKKYSSNSLTGFVSEVHLKYLHLKLYSLHNDHSVVLDKIEINQRKLSKYQLIVFDFHSLHILVMLKNSCLVFFFFLIKKSMCFISAILFKVRIERSSYQYFSLQFLQAQELTPETFYLLVFTCLPQWCKVTRSHLVQDPNY